MIACHIPIKPARVIALYLAFILLGAMMCLWSVPLSNLIKSGITPVLLVIAYRIYQQYWLSSGSLNVIQINLRSLDYENTLWEFINTHHEKRCYQCKSRAYLSPSWLCLRFIPDHTDHKKTVKHPYLILHKSQVSPNSWRDLHISARYFSN